MHGQDLLTQACVFLAAALIAVPIATRLGLGSVLGYLLAGITIGPGVLGLVDHEGEGAMHLGEMGVVIMLFLVGLELEPARLWRMRVPVLGLGGAQMAASAAVIGAGAWFVGATPGQSFTLGVAFALSSTAIALQSLAERGLLGTDGGQRSFAVLLFQDVSVIPVLALLPLLGVVAVSVEPHGHGAPGPTGLTYGLMAIGAVLAVVLAGRLLVTPLMRAVARTGMREMFAAAALGLVLGVTWVMTQVGLSPALGTFLAGVVLANSEYRHELESDLEPFKGLLLGLFFLGVGTRVDLALIGARPLEVGGLLLAVLVAKAVVLLALGRLFRASLDATLVLAVALAGVGEFAFVLAAMARQVQAVTGEQADLVVAVTACSMAVSPLLFLLHSRVLAPRLGTTEKVDRPSDVHDDHAPVIIAGYGRFGQIAGRLLRARGVTVTVLDVDADQVEVVRKFGNEVYFGDASRLDLLRAAGAAKAKLLLVAIDDHAKVLEVAHVARAHFPQLKVLARARGRWEAFELMDAGVHAVYRETFDTSLRAGADMLTLLGLPAHQAWRSARLFAKHDEASLVMQAAIRHDEHLAVRTARERIALLDELLQRDDAETGLDADDTWDGAQLSGRAEPSR